jgi:hypothetical protein
MGVTKADRERELIFVPFVHHPHHHFSMLNRLIWMDIDWTMVEIGWLVVHFFSEEGRTLHDVESQVTNTPQTIFLVRSDQHLLKLWFLL